MNNVIDWKILKKTICSLMVLALCGIGFVSCGDDLADDHKHNSDPDPVMEWDISPVLANIYIKGATGQNLLDPEVPGSWFGKDIWMDYNGKKEEAKWENPFYSRVYMAAYMGLYISYKFKLAGEGSSVNIPDPTTHFLQFGEFDGAKNQDINCSLHFEGLDNVYNIQLTNRIVWKNNKPEITREVRLDGELMPNKDITITLPPY